MQTPNPLAHTDFDAFNFFGKVALVTGAASGIGRATAVAFARAGADVTVADIDADGGKQTVRMIEEIGRKALFVRCDVARESDIRELHRQAIETFGRLDYAFNNAGIEGEPARVADMPGDNWDRTLEVNLRSVWLCMTYQIPQMLKQGGGAIVNCASIAGLVGFEGMGAYVASKHGVVGLTKVAALDYAATGIRVNAVCPGVIQTPMIDRFTRGSEDARRQLASGAPMGRVGVPDEIAGAVLWLCSDLSSFATGQAIAVDGGWTVR